MSRRGLLTILAALAFVATLYCLSGYIMSGSFGAASDNPQYASNARAWGIATLVSLALGVLF